MMIVRRKANLLITFKSAKIQAKTVSSKTLKTKNNMKNTIYYFCFLLAMIGFIVTALGTKPILNEPTLTLTGIFTTCLSGLVFLIVSYNDKQK